MSDPQLSSDSLTIRSNDWSDLVVEIGADDELYLEILGQAEGFEAYTWITREEGERVFALLKGWLRHE